MSSWKYIALIIMGALYSVVYFIYRNIEAVINNEVIALRFSASRWEWGIRKYFHGAASAVNILFSFQARSIVFSGNLKAIFNATFWHYIIHYDEA